MSVDVTVVVPLRDDAEHVEACLRAVGDQLIGKDRLEVLVVDGGSTDGSGIRAAKALRSLGLRGEVVVSPGSGSAADNLNVALQHARARYLVRVDARARLAPDYVGRCLEVLQARPEVAVVGGAQVPAPPVGTTTGRAIARALSNRWCTGLSRYRRSLRSGPADTVWMGAFRTEEVRSAGGWRSAGSDPRNEDYELNQRFRDNGRIVWFDGSLRTTYVPRATARAVTRQYLSYGRVKGRQWVRTRRLPARHAALLCIAVGVACSAVSLGRRRGAPVAAAVLAGTALALDAAGSGRQPARPVVRLKAAALVLVVDASWVAGAALGALEEACCTIRENARRCSQVDSKILRDYRKARRRTS